MKKYSRIIIGAGFYGLYAALFCAERGIDVLVLEYEDAPFKRATYINQARVHMGYHYPRSISTALKSRGYFDKFNSDYGFCVHSEFDKIYATSASFSWSNAQQFKKFCEASSIPLEEISAEKYFKKGMCDGAFLTTEYTYDAYNLRDYLLGELKKHPNAELKFSADIDTIEQGSGVYEIRLKSGEKYSGGFILNATYASVNQIQEKLGFEAFKIKYELCEIILCTVSDKLKNVGITVMDGPFFSIMPFGKTGVHSLTSVTFTPHITSYESTPVFECQSRAGAGCCTPAQLGNCNTCKAKPESAYPYMSSLARKYLRDEFDFEYKESLFSVKPILKASEIDDSRPTVIKQFSDDPVFISVLSGKINTVYDLNEVLINGKI